MESRLVEELLGCCDNSCGIHKGMRAAAVVPLQTRKLQMLFDDTTENFSLQPGDLHPHSDHSSALLPPLIAANPHFHKHLKDLRK